MILGLPFLMLACSEADVADLPDVAEVDDIPDVAEVADIPAEVADIRAEVADITFEVADIPDVAETDASLDTDEPDDSDALAEADVGPELIEPTTCARLEPPAVEVGVPLTTPACNADEPCDPDAVYTPDIYVSFDGYGTPGLIGEGYVGTADNYSYGPYQGAPAGSMEVSVEAAFKVGNATNGCLIGYDGRTFLALATNAVVAYGYGAVEGELVEGRLPLSGYPPRSWDAYADGRWHHIAMTLDARTGRTRFYFDGVTSPELETTTGGIQGLAAVSWFGTGPGCVGWSLDELAIYDRVLPSALVAEHAAAVLGGLAYPERSACAPLACAPTTYESRYAPEEFAPTGDDGLPSGDALTELASYPLPRYREGHGLHRMESWIQALWVSADNDLVTHSHNADSIAVQAMQVIAKDWHYYFDLSHLGCPGLDYEYCAEPARAFLAAHPEIPTVFQTYPPTVDRSEFILAEARPACPLGLNPLWSGKPFHDASLAANAYQLGLSQQVLGRPIDLIVEDGETWWEGRQWGGPPLAEADLLACAEADPEVMEVYQRDYVANGLSGRQMWTDAFKRWRLAWNDGLRESNGDPDTDILWYGMDGYDGWNAGDWWLGAREVNLATGPQTFGGEPQHYSGMDFYPPYHSFDYSMGPRHGVDWLASARGGEIGAGDHLFWPFVASGWTYEQYNIRPGMWLGLMKVLAAFGAESYHACYFGYPSHTPGAAWVWNAAIPAYAQAVTSRWEDLLRASVVVSAGMQTNPRHYVVVRQVLDADRQPQKKWLVAGNVNRWENTVDTLYRKESVVDVRVGDETLRLPIRMQGVVFVYDATGPEPVLTQLDAWHEWTHPAWWSRDFAFEAEVDDGATGVVHTLWSAPVEGATGEVRDGVAARTVRTMVVGDSARFAFEPRRAERYDAWLQLASEDAAEVIVRVGDAERRLVLGHGYASQWFRVEGGIDLEASATALEVEVVSGGIDLDALRLVAASGPTSCVP